MPKHQRRMQFYATIHKKSKVILAFLVYNQSLRARETVTRWMNADDAHLWDLLCRRHTRQHSSTQPFHCLELQQCHIHQMHTSNSVTEFQSASVRLFAGMWRPLVSVITTHSITLRLFVIVECHTVHFLCAVHVFEVRASSSSPTLLLWQISFLSRSPLLS